MKSAAKRSHQREVIIQVLEAEAGCVAGGICVRKLDATRGFGIWLVWDRFGARSVTSSTELLKGEMNDEIFSARASPRFRGLPSLL